MLLDVSSLFSENNIYLIATGVQTQHKSEFVPCRQPTEATQQSNENTEVPIILDLENQNINP